MSAKAHSAATALKFAIDRHLAACEARAGENDPFVQEAYESLRQAAEAYDDALFEAHDEVTPFEFANPTPEVIEVDGDASDSVSVLLRRDFEVVDPDATLASAEAARVLIAAAADPDDAEDDDDPEHVGSGIYALVHAYGG